MADIETWQSPPDTDLRRLKTKMEDEMMIKLGAKKETIEFHPLILCQRLPRAKTSFQPEYSRVIPPLKEQQPPHKNAWNTVNQATRQMSNISRHGPRQTQLPRVPQTKPVKTIYIPTEDTEYKKLRYLRLTKRDEILTEWSVLQRQAFAVKKVSHLSLPDGEPLRRYSSASLFSLTKSPTLKVNTDEGSRGQKKAVPFTIVPPTGKPSSRWKGMARQLLWNSRAAQMRLPEELPRSEVRVYISCTEDLTEEREFLAEVAYPELRRFCEKQGLSCHVVDLRNGTNRLKNSKETFDVIQREITKCQKTSIGPCFVSLVGREADAEQLPGWLGTEDMLGVRAVLVKAEKQAAVEALDNMYRLDSNYQPPVYLLEESYFTAEVKESAILRQVLPEVLTQLREEGRATPGPDYYAWSSTVKEIEAGLLSCQETKRQTVCLMSRAVRNSAKIAEGEVESNPLLSPALLSKLSADYTASTGNHSADKLRASVVERYDSQGNNNNLVMFTESSRKTVAYFRELCTLFLSAVTGLVERQITHLDFDVTHHLSPAADVVEHVAVGRRWSVHNLGGEEVVARLPDLLGNPIQVRPVLVTGGQGSGKTSLTCLLAAALPRFDPRRKVVVRVLGLTLSSSSLFHLLLSLIRHIAFLYDLQPSLPADLTLTTSLQAFRALLHDVKDKLAHKGFLTIVLDGVDKLPDMTLKHLSFLLASLPPGTNILMSASESSSLCEEAKTLMGMEVVRCPEFTPRMTEAYLKAFLARRDRILTNDQTRAILKEVYAECVPLVARVSACMAERWPSHTLHDQLDVSRDLDSACHRMLEAWESALGQSFTRHVLSLLAASRYGLAEFEVLHIISTDTALIDAIKEEAEDLSVLEGYPYQMQLSRLLTRLDPFLFEAKSEGETLLKIANDALKNVVSERYLSDSFKHHIHERLAMFFQFTRRGHLLSSKDIVEGRHQSLSRYLWRTLRSVPYHLCHADPDSQTAWKKLKSEVFLKFSWIVNEIYAGFFNDFVDDLNYALETLGLDPDVLLMREFLSKARGAVVHNPVSLASLMAAQDMPGMQEVAGAMAEAQEWLKQVHLQVLVPASFTAPQASPLQLNPALARRLRSLLTQPTEDTVVLQYDTRLAWLDARSGEETALVTAALPIVSTHLWGSDRLTLVTASSSGRLMLDTYAVDRGRHLKSTSLPDSGITWLHVKPDGTAFYASGRLVKKVQLEKGQVTELCQTKEDIVDAATTDLRQTRLVTLHATPTASLHVLDTRRPGTSHAITLPDCVISTRCKPLSMTRDGLHVTVACDRELLVVSLHVERLLHTLTFNNLPVSLTALSRSHEHVFVTTPTGLVRCVKLKTGTVVMDTIVSMNVKQKQESPRQSARSSSSPRTLRSASPGRGRSSISPMLVRKQQQRQQAQEKGGQEQISCLLTSEDDHFLLAGTSRGRVVILHVATGLEVCAIRSGEEAVREVVYFTSAGWFQNLVTLDAGGLAKLWNLRPVLSAARRLIMDIITDQDLTKEEEAKLDLGVYFNNFLQRRNDRLFLNGPDVSAFYQNPPPPALFSPLLSLDPALRASQTWLETGSLRDCVDIAAIATGVELSEILVTATAGGDVIRWSLHDGSVVSARPCPVQTEGSVQSVRGVYYDQAVCLALGHNNGRQTVLVQYTDEKKTGPLLVLNDVIATHVSSNGFIMIHVCSGQQAELTLVVWNLVTGQEQQRIVLSQDMTLTRKASTLTFSNDLNACAIIVPGEKGEKHTLYYWRLNLKVPETQPQKDLDEESEERQLERGGTVKEQGKEKERKRFSEKSSATSSVPVSQSSSDVEPQTLSLHFLPTAVSFAFKTVVLLGTSQGLTLLLDMGTATLTSALTSEGVESVKNEIPSEAGNAWQELSSPHASAVKSLTCMMGSHVVMSTSDSSLGVWSLLQKRLLVKVALDAGEQFIDHVLSRDARVLTYVTSQGVLAVWGVKERKQLCTFKLRTAITSLRVTPDCRNVALLVTEGVTSRVQVFEVRNIDDIRMGKDTQQELREESPDLREEEMEYNDS